MTGPNQASVELHAVEAATDAWLAGIAKRYGDSVVLATAVHPVRLLLVQLGVVVRRTLR